MSQQPTFESIAEVPKGNTAKLTARGPMYLCGDLALMGEGTSFR